MLNEYSHLFGNFLTERIRNIGYLIAPRALALSSIIIEDFVNQQNELKSLATCQSKLTWRN